MKDEKELYVTRPDLPDFGLYAEKLKQIWENKILTNNGPLHQEFESKLKAHLGVDHLSVYSNGTIALLAALKALDLKGKVITTPFSFVATAHSILWNNLEPVFADIDPKTGNLDPESVKKLITSDTSAIMPVHVYGNPCDLEAFEKIRKEYGVKLIYDAAHCFDVKLKDKSILLEGDLSILSFHATKAFNSIEGGAIVSKDPALIEKLNLFKNFGFRNELEIDGYGINGKLNEFQAAFGILQLDNLSNNIQKRKICFEYYKELLAGVKGIEFIDFTPSYSYNYSYFPIIVKDDYKLTRDGLYDRLKAHSIFSRRYFFPLISNLNIYKDFPSASPELLTNANYLGDRILTLPLYSELSREDIERICKLVV
ncbi:MAG: DegT/DnrJ/EryC1/StrS family aminotransferase [Crocinitomicaceae bacterium]|nr:DegT/DnrJ/EryC1/StrS family aminotransferase [Crocinitomicaceae bacterium]